jgi:hypothetical protein
VSTAVVVACAGGPWCGGWACKPTPLMSLSLSCCRGGFLELYKPRAPLLLGDCRNHDDSKHLPSRNITRILHAPRSPPPLAPPDLSVSPDSRPDFHPPLAFAMARLASVVVTIAVLALGVAASPVGPLAGLDTRQETTCGAITCAAGTTCCNASCGVCVAPGGSCSQEVCEPTPCGPTSCAGGLECCNSSCGYCVVPGARCTKELCPAQ